MSIFNIANGALYHPSAGQMDSPATNFPALQQLAGPCRQSHTNLPWGFYDYTFATTAKTEYHTEMVQAVSSIPCTVVPKGETLVADNPVAYISTSQPHKRRRAATNKQPRGKQLPAVISEFKQYQHSDSRLCASNKYLKFLRSGSDGVSLRRNLNLCWP